MPKIEYAATGRRKSSVARVNLVAGKGKIIVNNRDSAEYFRRETLLRLIQQPFDLLDLNNKYDVIARVSGGGLSGQAGALRHGIARALEQMNEEYRPILKKAGLLTRDPRKKERKKYGLRGARRAFQFSKR